MLGRYSFCLKILHILHFIINGILLYAALKCSFLLDNRLKTLPNECRNSANKVGITDTGIKECIRKEEDEDNAFVQVVTEYKEIPRPFSQYTITIELKKGDIRMYLV